MAKLALAFGCGPVWGNALRGQINRSKYLWERACREILRRHASAGPIAVNWAAFGGLITLYTRTELAAPGEQFLSNEQSNQLLTMHGTVMHVM